MSVVLILALLLSIPTSVQQAHGMDILAIDVFTQKEPYSGRGTNEPSDVFSPREEVLLYASVSNNSMPLENQEVTFEIYGPATDPPSNNTFKVAALTNASGIAATSFVLPWAPECFGQWSIYAKANVSGREIEDLTWFTVYWVVEILWMETGTLSGHWTWAKRAIFAKGELVDVKVILKNIAWLEKNVTITVTVYDSLGVPIAFKNLKLIIPANSTKTVYVEDLFIPKWAFSCDGDVVVAALMPDGAAYCPQKNQTIKILRCEYVGGTNFPVNKPFISSWILTIALLAVFTLVTSITRKRYFKNKSHNYK